MTSSQAPRRVALIVSSLRSGGVERMRLTLARGFLARGMAVDLVVVDARGDLRPAVPAGVRLVDLGKAHMRSAWWSLVAYLRRERPDAVLTAQTHLNLVVLAACACIRSRPRVVVSEHIDLSAVLAQDASWKIRLYPLGVRLMYPLADSVVAVSGATARGFARATGFPESRVGVIYNPVITPDLPSLAAAPAEHAWFADPTVPVILSVGRLTKQKDYGTLLRAFAQVRRTRRARLVILGDGSERAHLERLAAELGISDDVALPGFTPNPFASMARARVFVVSSRWEGCPNVLVEAMGCGTPVVSTDCPSGPHEVLERGVHGPLTPVGDADAMAAAIAAALEHPVAPEQLVRRAQHFSEERAVEAYLQLLLP